jgi:hypothetical protein
MELEVLVLEIAMCLFEIVFFRMVRMEVRKLWLARVLKYWVSSMVTKVSLWVA